MNNQVYRNFSIDFIREIVEKVESQYLFVTDTNIDRNADEVISTYQCSYSSSIRLKEVMKSEDEGSVFYFYEPIDCIPMRD